MLDFEARGKPEYPEKTPMYRVENKQTLSLDPHTTPGMVLEPAGYIGARRVFSTLHQPYTRWLSRSPATRNGRPKTEFFFSIWCLAPANCVWRIGGGANPHVTCWQSIRINNKEMVVTRIGFPQVSLEVVDCFAGLIVITIITNLELTWLMRSATNQMNWLNVTQMEAAKSPYKLSDHFWWFVGKIGEPAEKCLKAE